MNDVHLYIYSKTVHILLAHCVREGKQRRHTSLARLPQRRDASDIFFIIEHFLSVRSFHKFA